MKIQDPLTYSTIGCCMNIHNELGSGFQEVIYQRCLEVEFGNKDINYAREVEIPVLYKKVRVGTRRVDFVIDGRLILEIKAIAKLEEVHLAQALNYIEAYDMEGGLLINFGGKSLEWKLLFKK